MLLHHQFHAKALLHPQKEALVVEGKRFTYGALWHTVEHLSATLRRRGIKRGDRVAIFMPNSMEMVVAVFAALRAGAVFSPVSPQTKAGKLHYILEDSAPTCLLTDAGLRGVWTEALAGTESVRTVVVAGLDAAPDSPDDRLLPFDTAAAYAGEILTDDAGAIDLDLASIIYTSGSTGDPKGVMLTHHNMVSAANSIATYLGLRDHDVIMCALPLSFDYGLYQILMAFKVGAAVILEQSFAFPVKNLEIMARERVTAFPGVPTMFSLLMALDNLSRFDLSALRMITNTAAALSDQHIKDLRNLFPQARLFSMYGLTECKRVTYLPPEELDRRPTSVGKGMPNEEVYLVDDTGRRLPPGSVGELVVRGSNVMRGYWRKPEETAKRLKPGPFPGEFVLHTGDIFRMDEEGFLYFVSRKDDIIKSRGEKVAPKEVENVLYSLPGVLEAAVVGVADPLLGEAVKAYLILKPGHHYTERDVIKYCLAHLESFMAPKHVEFVATLPKTTTGKISRTELKAQSMNRPGS